ncbi:cytochrome C biogenesis protein [Parabacteroides sp. 52]|uniref:cytochrome c biogenesis protein CcsA n=1 Tax=unclassified Parabacteroides TaxID=2649774 RepID=UPI0013D89D01|nr:MULTISPECIES: cytochrome c biogenesis protein CcsA [unclassified Parabacteroides]MDH6534489.1 cytochrome c-type biogenesis protein CcsB [Parabacteroides sp. PM5-20]NDV55061.1 cytochrome C biogenesis protein [Parabacteroides sp. 52]
MKTKIEQIFSSYLTTIVLLVVYAVGLAVATFIEKYHGTLAAKAMVYYSPLFFLLQFLLVVNFITVVVKRQVWKQKKWGMIFVHSAFIVILLGALVSHIFGEEGILHLREGESNNRIAIRTSKDTYFKTLPFEVELIKFTLTRYPGSSSPSSYESELWVHVDGETRKERVYMNNILDVKGYRFFQASYDKDEGGTVLSVNKDVAGRNITYTGYLLLLAGLVLSLLGKHTRFMYLSRRLKELRKETFMTLLCLSVFGMCSSLAAQEIPSPMFATIQKYAIEAEHAAKFSELPIQSSNGRMLPVNTFSSEILRKLHKSDKIGTLNSDQFLISLVTLPDMWMRVPFIIQSNEELSSHFNLSKGMCAYIEMFDDKGNYKLQQRLEDAYNKMPAERSSFDKDLMKLDEKVNIMHQLINHQMLNLFPQEDDPNHTWYAPGDDLSSFQGKDSLFVSQIFPWYLGEIQGALQSGDWSKADEIVEMIYTYQKAKNKTLDINPKRIRAEIHYNRMDIFRQCKKGYLILGGLMLIFSFVSLFKQERGMKYISWLLGTGVFIVFLFHMAGMGVRWYIAGHAPWSNSYETMVYVAWATVFAGLLFARRSPVTFSLATLFAGIILFVSGLNWMDPEINPLVPVLKSPWLMFHVAVIVGAYGFFGISCLIGLTNLVMILFLKAKNIVLFSVRIRELSIINEMSLLIGLALMTIGTFLGAVWANESWGRYWGWDPKETWALITMVVYAITLHLRLVKKWDNPWLFNLMSVLSFASVLMTFFGVNYFLSGMHSYGQNDHVNNIFIYLYGAAIIVSILAVFSRWKYKKTIGIDER